MTVLVGVLCEDGVVLGSDSSGTIAGGNIRTIEQPLEKTFIVGDDVIFAGTGQVGLGQRFKAILEELRRRPDFDFAHQDPLIIAMNICANAVNNFAFTHAPKGEFGALVAFTSRSEFHLCEFAVRDFQPEFKTRDMWFVSMGSGQPITDPLLGLLRRVFFKGSCPRLNEGVFAVAWALAHAIELNTGGIQGPPQIGVLARDAPDGPFQARLLTDEELAEHDGNVHGVETHLAAYRELLSGGGEKPIPDLDT